MPNSTACRPGAGEPEPPLTPTSHTLPRVRQSVFQAQASTSTASTRGPAGCRAACCPTQTKRGCVSSKFNRPAATRWGGGPKGLCACVCCRKMPPKKLRVTRASRLLATWLVYHRCACVCGRGRRLRQASVGPREALDLPARPHPGVVSRRHEGWQARCCRLRGALEASASR